MLRSAATIALLLSSLAAPASASDWRVLAQFDDAPEGLVSDGAGGYFVSLYHSGHIMRVGKDGKKSQIADLRSVVGDAEGSTVGLDWDGKDTIYVAFSEYSKHFPWPAKADLAVEACGDATVTKSGLYKVAISTARSSRW